MRLVFVAQAATLARVAGLRVLHWRFACGLVGCAKAECAIIMPASLAWSRTVGLTRGHEQQMSSTIARLYVV